MLTVCLFAGMTGASAQWKVSQGKGDFPKAKGQDIPGQSTTSVRGSSTVKNGLSLKASRAMAMSAEYRL